MRTKTYATALMAASATLFFAVIGANVAHRSAGHFPGAKTYDYRASTNDRYIRFKAYQAAADSYDGLLFGSSRGQVFPLDELSRLSGGVKFASFAVYGGMIT